MIVNISKENTGSKNINIELSSTNITYSTCCSKYNLNDVLRIENLNKIESLNSKYIKLLNQLNISNANNISIGKILGSNIVKSQLNTIKDIITNLKLRDLKYYDDHYWKRCNLTSMIDNSIYDHSETVTGRSKIKSGTNYLTMKKKSRKNIKSVFNKGKIIEIDIISLEPRILLKHFNLSQAKDVYKDILNNLALNNVTRDKLKLGLLAIIYGAANETVRKLSGLSKKDIEMIKEYFKVKKLNYDLKNEYDYKNCIRNMYHRPINSNSALVNHYIQSSAADCAQIAFYNYLKDVNKNKFRLIAVIHDAIIVDVHPDLVDYFLNTNSIYEEYLDILLPVTSEILS